jgi:hypothetical protein
MNLKDNEVRRRANNVFVPLTGYGHGSWVPIPGFEVPGYIETRTASAT